MTTPNPTPMPVLLAGGPHDLFLELAPKLGKLGLPVVEHWSCERTRIPEALRAGIAGVVIVRAPNTHRVHDRAKELAKAGGLPFVVVESKVSHMLDPLRRAGMLPAEAAAPKEEPAMQTAPATIPTREEVDADIEATRRYVERRRLLRDLKAIATRLTLEFGAEELTFDLNDGVVRARFADSVSE